MPELMAGVKGQVPQVIAVSDVIGEKDMRR